MSEKKETQRRTQVKDLPKREKQLSREEQRKVKGGGDITDTSCDAKGLAIGRGIHSHGT